MRVMVLTTAFAHAAPVMGAFLLARWLHRNAIDVTFAALDEHPGGLLADVRASGLPSHTFALNGWRGMRRRAAVQRYVEEQAIDVVMSDGLRPDIVCAGLRGVTRVSNVRGILGEHYALDFPIVVAQVVTRLQARALRRMDAVFAISPEIADHLARLGVKRERLHIVDNFIDVDDVRSAGQGAPNLGPGAHVGLFAALINRKRIDLAVRAFATMLRREPIDATLHIAGDGPLRKRLTSLARDLNIARNVVFHGFVERPLPLMAAMDVVLLTSDREGVPRSLMEAMALGRTCVSSAFPGVSSLIEEGVTGYTFPPGDLDALVGVLSSVVGERRAIDRDRLLTYMRERHDVGVCAPLVWGQILRIAAR